MKWYYPNIKGFQIKRRTFEGKTNPAKNNKSLTSKYYTSLRYWLEIEYDNYFSEACYRTKAKCLEVVGIAKKIAGTRI